MDMAKAAPSSSPAAATTSHPGGIEALNLKAGPARRNLFGSVDHQQLQQDFRRLLSMNVEAAKKRWNFDFQREVPGEGSDVEWEELRSQDVPAFYHSCTMRPAPRPMPESRAPSSSGGEGSSPGHSSSSGSGDEYLEVTTRGRYRIGLHGQRKQSAITDFFKVKKRKLLHYKPSSWQ
uniref:Cyclin-dependent kinase inhibitor domain-containing protein n=1 Tax=Gasterosteus aculeatus aculeatus TaxID=481459 RepID=A0AAQ4RV23_GASAC